MMLQSTVSTRDIGLDDGLGGLGTVQASMTPISAPLDIVCSQQGVIPNPLCVAAQNSRMLKTVAVGIGALVVVLFLTMRRNY